MNQERGRAERRRQRQTHIARRVKFIRNALHREPWRAAGTLAKRKALDCSCWMCSGHSKFKWRRGKERHQIKSALRQSPEVLQ